MRYDFAWCGWPPFLRDMDIERGTVTDPLNREATMTGPDPNAGRVGRGVTPGYGKPTPKGGKRHDKPGVTKSPAPKPPTKGGKGRGGSRGR